MTRPSLGSRLVERLESRKARRPRVGLTPAFYARFGLADPWLDLAQDAGAQEAGEHFSFLSGKRYYRAMRRLAFSRWRREKRLERFERNRPGLRTMARKGFPGEARRRVSWNLALSSSDLVLPEPIETAPQTASDTLGSSGAWARPKLKGPTTRTVGWGSQGSRPTRVAHTESGDHRVESARDRSAVTRHISIGAKRVVTGTRAASLDRPAERVGRRLQQVAVSRDPLQKALDQAAPRLTPSVRRQVDRVLRRTEVLDEAARVIEVRRVLRRVAGARVVRQIVEDAPITDAVSRPTQVARGRAGPLTQRRGLRPVLSHSPSMSVVTQEEQDEPVQSTRPAFRKTLTGPTARALSSSPVTPVVSTARVVRTASGAYTRAQGLHTQAGPTRATRVVRTASGAFVGARHGTTASGDSPATATHRTRSGQTGVSGTHRTASGQTSASATHRTPAGSTAASLVHRTGARQDRGASLVRTASGEWVPTSSVVTAASAHAAARAFRTAGSTLSPARTATATRDAGGRFVGARSGVTATAAFTGARSGRTASAPLDPSRLVRTARRAVEGARSVSTVSSEWTPARVSEGASWAADRLEVAGTSRRQRSVMPRVAPRLHDGQLVLPVQVQSLEEAEAAVAAIRKATPGATVSVSKGRGWGPSPGDTRSTTQVASAARRAEQIPVVGQAAARAATSSWATPAAAPTPKTASGRRAERRLRGPGAYAAASSVALDAVTVQPQAGSSEEPVGSTARAFHTGGERPQASTGVRTGRSAWTAARSGTTATRPLPSAADWAAPEYAGPSASTARRLRTQGRPFQGSQAYRTPDGDWLGASSFTTAQGDWTGARTGSARPIDWVGARVAIGQTPAYRGYAKSFRTGSAPWTPATSMRTGRQAWTGAQRFVTGAGLEMVTPEAHRPELTETLGAMHSGVPAKGVPAWAERTALPDRLSSSQDLVQSLVAATDPTQVVQVILEKGLDLRRSNLPKPVIQVIEQIKTEAARQESPPASRGGGSSSRSGWHSTGARSRSGSSRSRRSTTRVLSGWTGLKPGAAATTTSGVGDNGISKLAKKLRGLIHLAEGQRTSDAQRQAKLAHRDRPDARMDEGGDKSSSESAALANVDIEALGREVLEVVVRELELRQERRQEESDGNIWW
jgi:hypothetical protein